MIKTSCAFEIVREQIIKNHEAAMSYTPIFEYFGSSLSSEREIINQLAMSITSAAAETHKKNI